MRTILPAIFLVLHGLVHLLYVGQSRRLFELRPGLAWPSGSWAFSGLFGDETVRLLAAVSLVLAALGFGSAGLGIAFGQAWGRTVAAGAALLSILLFVLFWDGKFQAMDAKGAVALLINLAILVIALR